MDRFTTSMRRLRDWMFEQNPSLSDRDITPESRLFEEGILDSLQSLALLLAIEEIRGVPIPRNQIKAKSFSSLMTIEEAFFK